MVGLCVTGPQFTAKITGVSHRQTLRIFGELETLGLIRSGSVRGGPGRGHEWRLLDKSRWRQELIPTAAAMVAQSEGGWAFIELVGVPGDFAHQDITVSQDHTTTTKVSNT